MNSLRSAWTPFLAGPSDSKMQAKGKSEARSIHSYVEIYSLSDWHKISVSSIAGPTSVRVDNPHLRVEPRAAGRAEINFEFFGTVSHIEVIHIISGPVN